MINSGITQIEVVLSKVKMIQNWKCYAECLFDMWCTLKLLHVHTKICSWPGLQHVVPRVTFD
jgi:hypothetical protein